VNPIKAPKGVRDIFPPEIKKWQYVEGVIKSKLESFGFEEIRTPIFEQTELFTRGIGPSSDIVHKEMYSFVDRGGRKITLKPEGTASVIRAYLEHHLGEGKRVVKFYYLSPMFRYERPQANRYRQHYQIGVELIGEGHFLADVEIFLLFFNIFSALQLKDFRIKINSIGCASCRPEYVKILKEKVALKKHLFCADCQRRWETNPLRLLDCKKETCQKLRLELPFIKNFLCTSCSQHYSNLLQYLNFFRLRYEEDPFLVRGLDYYTKTTFEFISSALGAQDAFGGGGRYDGLVAELGGPAKPAIGFSLGIERLLEVMEKTKVKIPSSERVKFFFIHLGEKTLRKMSEISLSLKQMGYPVESFYEEMSLKNQLRWANKLGYRYCLILGEDELKEEVILLKDLAEKKQESVKMANLLNRIRELE
jgi:histidyl-tRNA synthetase